MKFIIIIMMSTLLFMGCSSIQVIERTVEIPVYIERQDTLLLKDSISVIDTFWYSDITDSLKGVIGSLKVWYNRKLAELKIKYPDTVKVTVVDTLTVEKEKPISVISGFLPIWAEAVLIVIAVLLLWISKGKLIKPFV